MMLAKAKRSFARAMDERYPNGIPDIPNSVPWRFEYHIFVPRHGWVRDIGNVASILDKFFADYLIDIGAIPDDDFEHIPQMSSIFGGYIDKNVEAYGECRIYAS